jgi:mono/diheme cytochrome c family protein
MFARAIREGVGHDGRVLSWQMPFNFFKNLSDEDLASVVVYIRSLPPVRHVVPKTKIPKQERAEEEKWLKPPTKPFPKPDFSTPEKRGEYLVTLAECVGCHTSHSEYNPGLFAGGNYAHRHGRVAFSANITTDASGIGYGPKAFANVIHTGKGGTLSAVMPWVAFRNMSDNDLNAIFAYLNTIPRARHYVNSQKPFTRCPICGEEHGLGNQNKIERPTGIKMDPNLYDHYAGTYLSKEWNARYIIIHKGTKLIGWQDYPHSPKRELIPQSDLHFLAPGWALPVTFSKDKDGHIIQLKEDTYYGGTFTKVK